MGFERRVTPPPIIQNLEQPNIPTAGLLDSRTLIGQSTLIGMVNRRLSLAALQHEGVYILDYDALVARHGRGRWTDEKKWLTARSPVAADCLIFAAREYLRYILPLSGRQSKVLVVDLDNTLWGGVIGEDGVTGIEIGSEYPGAAYLSLQRALSQIAQRGVLLAICSKNNLADAMGVLEKHPEMLLRPGFRCHAYQLDRQGAEFVRYRGGIERRLSIASPFSMIARSNGGYGWSTSEVNVIDLPVDPIGYAAAVLSCPLFERLTITAEDRVRRGYYAAQRERRSSESTAGSLEDFYRSLEMKSEIVAVAPATLDRIAQLTQKTNHLNTTTKRYTEGEVQLMARDPAQVCSASKCRSLRRQRHRRRGLPAPGWGGARNRHFLAVVRVIGRTVETMMFSARLQPRCRGRLREAYGLVLAHREK